MYYKYDKRNQDEWVQCLDLRNRYGDIFKKWLLADTLFNVLLVNSVSQKN